jgi:hypothetical protein
MPQGSFKAQVDAWVAETKARMVAVRNGAAQRTIAVMQEPGPSKATVKKAVAAGAGLGKLRKDGTRGVSKRAFGPVPNPGGSGNLPVDTGFLRASLVATVGKANFTLRDRPVQRRRRTYQYDDSEVVFAISDAKLNDPIEAVYTARYARVVEYGSRGRAGRRFVALAAQQWPRIVAEVVAEAKARAGG